MKTAEEWMKQLGGHDSTGEHPPIITVNRQIIREIQLDAYKAGMSEAARITHKTENQTTIEYIVRKEVKAAILSARDKKISL